MHSFRFKRRISMFLILAILFCEVCFDEAPFKTYSFCVSDSEISSSVRIHIVKDRQIFYKEQLTERSAVRGMIRRVNRRVLSASNRRSTAGLSFVDILPRLFHSSIFLRDHKVCHNTSGHIERIRCLYRKDGKKRGERTQEA